MNERAIAPDIVCKYHRMYMVEAGRLAPPCSCRAIGLAVTACYFRHDFAEQQSPQCMEALLCFKDTERLAMKQSQYVEMAVLRGFCIMVGGQSCAGPRNTGYRPQTLLERETCFLTMNEEKYPERLPER